MVDMVCWCGTQYVARSADLKRGWGLSCNKSHAAIRRDFGRPAATRVDGIKVTKVKKKNRGARRLTPDNRSWYNGLGSYGHLMASGEEGHGQE